MIQWAYTIVIGFVCAFVLAIMGTPVWLTVIVLGIFFVLELVDNT